MSAPRLPRLFTPAEVAEALQQSENYVLRQCRAGRWPHVRVARNAIRLTAEDFAAVVGLCHTTGTRTQPVADEMAPLPSRRPRRVA